MTATASAELGTEHSRPGPAAYCVVGLIWWGFLMIAFRTPMNEAVFWWTLTQGLLVEKVGAAGTPWGSRLLLLAAYMTAAVAAWWVIERTERDPSHVWRRAALAWVGIQIIYSLTATALVQTGILYE